MNNESDTSSTSGAARVPDRGSGRPFLLWLLTALLAAEALVVIAFVVVLIVDLFTQEPDSMPSAIALTVLVALGAIFITAVAINTPLRRPWIRAGALIWQLVQIAIGVGAFQGIYAQPLIGVVLVVPSIVVIGLLFTRPVLEATKREGFGESA